MGRYAAQTGADSIEKANGLERFRNASGLSLTDFHLDDLDLDLIDALPELEAALTEGVIAGAKDTAGLLGVDLKTPPAGALDYARDRAAELAGRKRTVSGALIPNPNPKWVISETLRADIKSKVIQAIEGGWSPQDLTGSLLEVFGPWRAETIARTETGFAYNEGAIAIYEEDGRDLVEILDGDGCLPLGHDDGAPQPDGEPGAIDLKAQANGQVWPVSALRDYRLGHPNCVRAFIPFEGDASKPKDQAAPEQAGQISDAGAVTQESPSSANVTIDTLPTAPVLEVPLTLPTAAAPPTAAPVVAAESLPVAPSMPKVKAPRKPRTPKASAGPLAPTGQSMIDYETMRLLGDDAFVRSVYEANERTMKTWFAGNPYSATYKNLRDVTTAAGKRFVKTLNRLPNHVGEIYRGMNATAETIAEWIPGREWTLLRTSSASTDTGIARRFLRRNTPMREGAPRRGVYLTVRSKTGKAIAKMSRRWAPESEVLLKGGTRYRVVSVSDYINDEIRNALSVVLEEI